jgi:hypothetical protein
VKSPGAVLGDFNFSNVTRGRNVKFLSVLFASACAVVLAAPASAHFSGTLGGGYAHISADGFTVNGWNANGAFAVSSSDDAFNFQGDAGYANISVDSVSQNDLNGGLAAFWRNDKFRAGASGAYSAFNVGNTETKHLINYGGFGEWFPGIFTLGAKVGGFTGSDGAGGLYLGGETAAYPLPNLALSATVDYADFNASGGFHDVDVSPQVEWLFSEEIPVSVYAGYTYVAVSNLPSGNIFFAGLRLSTATARRR